MAYAVSHLLARLEHTQEDEAKYCQILSIYRLACTAQRTHTTLLKLSLPFQEDKNNYLKMIMALEDKLFSSRFFPSH